MLRDVTGYVYRSISLQHAGKLECERPCFKRETGLHLRKTALREFGDILELFDIFPHVIIKQDVAFFRISLVVLPYYFFSLPHLNVCREMSSFLLFVQKQSINMFYCLSTQFPLLTV